MPRENSGAIPGEIIGGILVWANALWGHKLRKLECHLAARPEPELLFSCSLTKTSLTFYSSTAFPTITRHSTDISTSWNQPWLSVCIIYLQKGGKFKLNPIHAQNPVLDKVRNFHMNSIRRKHLHFTRNGVKFSRTLTREAQMYSKY